MKIGPNIAQELEQAGLLGKPFSWNPETGEMHFATDASGSPLMSQAEQDAALAIFAAHDPLPGLRAQAKQRLAEAAEAARQRLLSPGAGKILVYTQKRREARAIKNAIAAGKVPDAALYPFAARRAARKKQTLEQVANEWLAKDALWRRIAAEIEDTYDAAVEAIDALTNPDTFEADAEAIITGIRWPAP